MISSAREDKGQQKLFDAASGNTYLHNYFANFVHILVKLNMYNYCDCNFTLKSIPWGNFCPGAPEECKKRMFTAGSATGKKKKKAVNNPKGHQPSITE